MSDHSQGEGWWQASDGKWYPPEQAAPGYAAPTQPFGTTPPPQPYVPPAAGLPPVAPKKGLGPGPIIGIVVAVLAVLAAAAFLLGNKDDNKKNASAASASSSSRSSSSSDSSSSSSSGAPKVVAPDGFQVFSSDDDGFALALPSSMDVIDLKSADLDAIINALSSQNQALADLGPQIRSVFAAGGKLFAVDKSSASFGDSLNVLATPGRVDPTDPGARGPIEQQLRSIGGTNIVFDTVTAHGRHILTTSYEITITAPDGSPKTVFSHQAYLAAGGQLWVISFGTSRSGSDVFDTVVNSFDVSE